MLRVEVAVPVCMGLHGHPAGVHTDSLNGHAGAFQRFTSKDLVEICPCA
jgi:hypothetical protein